MSEPKINQKSKGLDAPLVSGCTFSVNKSYPRALDWDRYSIDNTYVQYEISTKNPLSGEFDAELMRLVEKYCR